MVTQRARTGRDQADPTADNLMDSVVQTSFATMASLSRLGAEHDLSLTQMRVLAILRDRRVRMTALSDHLGLEKSTLTGLVDRAQRRGLLDRAPNERDGRVVDVFLTEQGRELADRLRDELTTVLAPRLGRLTAAERTRLDVLLRRLLSTTDSD